MLLLIEFDKKTPKIEIIPPIFHNLRIIIGNFMSAEVAFFGQTNWLNVQGKIFNSPPHSLKKSPLSSSSHEGTHDSMITLVWSSYPLSILLTCWEHYRSKEITCWNLREAYRPSGLPSQSEDARWSIAGTQDDVMTEGYPWWSKVGSIPVTSHPLTLQCSSIVAWESSPVRGEGEEEG